MNKLAVRHSQWHHNTMCVCVLVHSLNGKVLVEYEYNWLSELMNMRWSPISQLIESQQYSLIALVRMELKLHIYCNAHWFNVIFHLFVFAWKIRQLQWNCSDSLLAPSKPINHSVSYLYWYSYALRHMASKSYFPSYVLVLVSYGLRENALTTIMYI